MIYISESLEKCGSHQPAPEDLSNPALFPPAQVFLATQLRLEDAGLFHGGAVVWKTSTSQIIAGHSGSSKTTRISSNGNPSFWEMNPMVEETMWRGQTAPRSNPMGETSPSKSTTKLAGFHTSIPSARAHPQENGSTPTPPTATSHLRTTHVKGCGLGINAPNWDEERSAKIKGRKTSQPVPCGA